MTYIITKGALKDFLEVNLDEKEVLLQRKIVNEGLNPMEVNGTFCIASDQDDLIRISLWNENIKTAEWVQIEYRTNRWMPYV